MKRVLIIDDLGVHTFKNHANLIELLRDEVMFSILPDSKAREVSKESFDLVFRGGYDYIFVSNGYLGNLVRFIDLYKYMFEEYYSSIHNNYPIPKILVMNHSQLSPCIFNNYSLRKLKEIKSVMDKNSFQVLSDSISFLVPSHYQNISHEDKNLYEEFSDNIIYTDKYYLNLELINELESSSYESEITRNNKSPRSNKSLLLSHWTLHPNILYRLSNIGMDLKLHPAFHSLNSNKNNPICLFSSAPYRDYEELMADKSNCFINESNHNVLSKSYMKYIFDCNSGTLIEFLIRLSLEMRSGSKPIIVSFISRSESTSKTHPYNGILVLLERWFKGVTFELDNNNLSEFVLTKYNAEEILKYFKVDDWSRTSFKTYYNNIINNL